MNHKESSKVKNFDPRFRLSRQKEIDKLAEFQIQGDLSQITVSRQNQYQILFKMTRIAWNANSNMHSNCNIQGESKN